jgi:hypothetical protein
VAWNKGSGVDPGFTMNLGDVDRTTSGILDPGNWYFSIRSFDRAGRANPGSLILGPFVLTEVDSVDLQYEALSGWEYPLVPRTAPDVSTVVEVSPSLWGGGDTYWNAAGRNTGDQAAATSNLQILVDGDSLTTVQWPYMGGGSPGSVINQGPVNIPGGRHMLEMFLDAEEIFPEDNEGDNHYAGQWVWTPGLLLADEVCDEPAPPGALAGFNYFRWEQPVAYNCAGHRIDYYSRYQAVFMYSLGDNSDYDLRLFDTDDWAEDGFDSPLAISGQPEGSLEVVLANGINAGLLNEYNIGVVNIAYDQGYADDGYRIGKVEDTYLDVNYDAYYGELDAYNMIDLYSFPANSSNEGYVTFRLRPQDDLPMYLSFFDENFAVGGLMDATECLMATQGSFATMPLAVPVGSVCGIAVWRHPWGPEGTTHHYQLDYFITPADMRTDVPDQWAAAIVPQPDLSITFPLDSVPEPTELNGNGDTYLYMAEYNESDAPAPMHQIGVVLDGEMLDLLTPMNPIDPDTGRTYRWASPYTVRPGRHSLVMALDPNRLYWEIYEDNNESGKQWVWSPELLTWDMVRSFDDLPDRYGGWDEVEETTCYPNCIGLRTPALDTPAGKYAFFGVVSEDNIDADLQVHEPSLGPRHGFTEYLVGSKWYGEGETDYILADLDQITWAELDVSLLNISGDDRVYVQFGTSSSTAQLNGTGTHGTYWIDGMMVVHELTLPAGLYEITLSTDPGSVVDLAFSVHKIYAYFTSRLSAVEFQGYGHPEREDESIMLEVEEEQTFPLLVWRENAHTYQDYTSYTITISEDLTGVEYPVSSLPTSTRLVGAWPNPFNPLTRIHYELDRGGEFSLTIYDVLGRRVRTLHSGPGEPGRHDAIWMGKDDQGRQVSSGVYYCRLVTEWGVRQSVKLTLVR